MMARERPRDGYYADRNCVPWYARMSFGERATVLCAADDDAGLSRHSLLQRFGVHSIYSRPIARLRLVNFREIMSGKRVALPTVALGSFRATTASAGRVRERCICSQMHFSVCATTTREVKL